MIPQVLMSVLQAWASGLSGPPVGVTALDKVVGTQILDAKCIPLALLELRLFPQLLRQVLLVDLDTFAGL